MPDEIVNATTTPTEAAPERSAEVTGLGLLAGLNADSPQRADTSPAAEAARNAQGQFQPKADAAADAIPPTDAPAGDASVAKDGDAAPATDVPADDEELTEEEHAALVAEYEKFVKSGGKAAPVAAPEAEVAAEAAPAAQAQPAAQTQTNEGVIPQYLAQVPADVEEAYLNGNLTPFAQMMINNQAAGFNEVIGNINTSLSRVPTMLGNMVETAVAAAFIERDNPAMESIRTDVINAVNAYRDKNPNTSTAQATREVAKEMAHAQVVSRAMDKFIKKGGNFADLRSKPVPNAPRPNARQAAAAKTGGDKIPNNPLARGLGQLMGLTD